MAAMPTAVPGRACGSCSLCCKLVAIKELEKPEGIWCKHCAPGRGGCLIYDSRPPSCQGYYCGWLQSDQFGSEWRPATCKMVISAEGEGNRLTVYVDPSFPTNWRREPYYSQLKQLAIEYAEQQMQLLVRINDRATVLLPNKEVDLGVVAEDDQIMVQRDRRLGIWDAFVVSAKDVPPEQRGKWIRS